MEVQRFSTTEVARELAAAYAPVTLASVDDFALRLVKFQGEFERWHTHVDADECFIVLSGEVTFQTEAGDFVVGGGEGLVIPKGMRHCPRASETGEMPVALIIERAGTERLGS